MNRPLSAGEHLLFLIDQAVPQNFVMVAHLSGQPANFREILEQALAVLQRRQPTLRCKIEYGEPPGYSTGRIPAIPLLIKERESTFQWERECEREMLIPMPWSQGPLIRVLLLEAGDSCDLLVTLCHIVADAAAGVKMVKQLLTYCGQLSRGQAPFPQTPLAPLPSIIELLKPEIVQKANAAPGPAEPGTDTPRPAELRGECDVPPARRITRIIQRLLNPREAKNLALLGRKEKTTLHSLFCAALMQSIALQIRKTREPGDKDPLLLGCLTPVNVRPHLALPGEDHMGNFISNAVHYQFIDENASLFEAARNTRRALQKELDNANDIRALLDAWRYLRVGEAPHDTLMRLKDSFAPTGVTDMGVLDIPAQFGPINLDMLHYNPAMNPVIKNGFGLSVSGYAGSIILDFLYAEPYISEKRARQMVETTMARLRNPRGYTMPRRVYDEITK